MLQLLTRNFILENKGCYETQQVLDLFSQELTLEELLLTDFPLKDKYWFVCNKLATKEQNIEIAIGVAEIVLFLFEEKYPEDKRPRNAIESAKLFISGHISEEKLLSAYTDAKEAANSAKAYDAAYSAAYSGAYSAFNAAKAVVYAYAAAYAYASAAFAYESADSYAEIKQRLLDFIVNFCKNA